MKPHLILGMLLCVLAVVCVGCKQHTAANDDVQIDMHTKVHVGMKGDQVLAALGSPTTTQTWIKTEQPIFGVLESWWSDLPEGAKVEIWDYPQSDGTVSIYFRDGTDAVWHTSFVKKGVVF